jgi:hypothetical protein
MNNIPEQYTGSGKDVDESIRFDEVKEAKQRFVDGRNKMMNVNEWEKIANGLSATFQLTDEKGFVVKRMPQKGDHFRIDIPASGAEMRYDWVRVEEIQETQSSDGRSESAFIRVRPCSDPQDELNNDVKHFFTDAATSTFMISRIDNAITGGVYSRNEKPNVSETEDIGEKLRNTFVAMGAVAGLSDVQWKNLVKGILNIN